MLWLPLSRGPVDLAWEVSERRLMNGAWKGSPQHSLDFSNPCFFLLHWAKWTQFFHTCLIPHPHIHYWQLHAHICVCELSKLSLQYSTCLICRPYVGYSCLALLGDTLQNYEECFLRCQTPHCMWSLQKYESLTFFCCFCRFLTLTSPKVYFSSCYWHSFVNVNLLCR